METGSHRLSTYHKEYIHVHRSHYEVWIGISTHQYMYLLDVSRQLACMKLGRREKYQPIQYCWASCLGYPVHTCHLPIDIQQIYCSAQTGQHERHTGAHAVLSGHCNIYLLEVTKQQTCMKCSYCTMY